MRIFGELQAMFHQRKSKNQDFDFKKYLREYQIQIGFFASMVLLITMPVAYPIVPYLLFGTMEMSLKYWYPFDPLTPTNFPIAALWTDWVVGIALVFLLASDSMLYALISVLTMEFDGLTEALINFRFTPVHERAERVKFLTNHHNRLLEIGDKLKDIYSYTFLISFAVSSMIMCFVAFQLTTAGGNLFIYAFYIPYMGMMGGQMLLLCNFGQKLIDASESVADGAYQSLWENSGDNNFNKQFILIMQRAQKPKKLTALGFADISLTTFTTVSCRRTVIKLQY